MEAPEIDESDVPETVEEEPHKAPEPIHAMPENPGFITAAFGIKSQVASSATKQPEKPKVDVSGVKVGEAVTHGKFGTGKVIELRGGYVTVGFAQGEKRFLFPGAFESGFLKVQ